VDKITKAAFIGLGVMGSPMAGHLKRRAGLDVTVYNRTQTKAEQWAATYGGHYAGTPAQAAKDADMVCLCVGNDNDVRAVVAGDDGILSTLRKGGIIVDHTTASAKVAREMAALARDRGAVFLDAPVSGGQSGAEKGVLTVMAGGDADAFQMVEPILRASYAREARLIGPSGSGQLCKMVNQICIAGTVQGLAEGLAFAMKAGLDPKKVLSAIGKGAAQSWQMDNRGETMADNKFDFGFAINLMIKDLHMALEEGHDCGAMLRNTAQVLDYYKELAGQGDGGLDTSALIKRLI
jgi:3-hydroxyisobutyrate dehydrogenase-like beta-hydroxyacid dehydrogenase